jgi:hypothetical protein
MGEGDTPRWEEGVSTEQAYRVRKSDVVAGITVAGLVGILSLFWSVTSQLSEALRTEVRNERVERINADQRLDARVYELERKGRR